MGFWKRVQHVPISPVQTCSIPHMFTYYAWVSLRWLLMELKSHQLFGGLVFRDLCTFGNPSIDVMSNWQNFAWSCRRRMASSRCRVFASCSAILQTTQPRYSLSVVNSLLPASNYTIFFSSWDAISCRVETGADSLPIHCWSIWWWKS